MVSILGLAACRSGESTGMKESQSSEDDAGTSANDAFPEDWWDDGSWTDAEDGEGGEGGEGGEDDDGDEIEEPHWYGFFVDSTASTSPGEVGWVDDGCEWYADMSGAAVDPCASCTLAYSVTINDLFVEADEGCDFEPEMVTSPEFSFVVGFIGEEALEYDPETGAWESFADAFYEGDLVGWFAQL